MGWSVNSKKKKKEIVKTFKDHGPHRRHDKSECQECTCKIDRSLNRRMCVNFESRKISVAGNECDKSEFDFHNAEHKELPVIKISSEEGREEKKKRLQFLFLRYAFRFHFRLRFRFRILAFPYARQKVAQTCQGDLF